MLIFNQTSFLLIICIVLIIILIIDRLQSDTRDEFSGKDIHERHMRGRDRDIQSADGAHEDNNPKENEWKDSKKSNNTKKNNKNKGSGMFFIFIVIIFMMLSGGFVTIIDFLISAFREILGITYF